MAAYLRRRVQGRNVGRDGVGRKGIGRGTLNDEVEKTLRFGRNRRKAPWFSAILLSILSCRRLPSLTLSKLLVLSTQKALVQFIINFTCLLSPSSL